MDTMGGESGRGLSRRAFLSYGSALVATAFVPGGAAVASGSPRAPISIGFSPDCATCAGALAFDAISPDFTTDARGVPVRDARSLAWEVPFSGTHARVQVVGGACPSGTRLGDCWGSICLETVMSPVIDNSPRDIPVCIWHYSSRPVVNRSHCGPVRVPVDAERGLRFVLHVRGQDGVERQDEIQLASHAGTPAWLREGLYFLPIQDNDTHVTPRWSGYSWLSIGGADMTERYALVKRDLLTRATSLADFSYLVLRVASGRDEAAVA